MRIRPLLFVVSLVCLLTAPARAVVLFSDDFHDNSAGWLLGPEWAIGPTMASSGQSSGTFPDPAFDHSPSADNGVAGTVIGGNITTALHSGYVLTSPPIDLSAVTGNVHVSFWRWLNLDYPPFMTGTIQVYNGSSWVTVFQSPASSPIADDAWTHFTYDVTAYKNSQFRVRFVHEVGQGGAYTVSGWNLDDFEVAGDCNDDLDGDGYVAIACAGNDCDDSNPAVHPGALEICGNGIDEDCDLQVDESTISYRDQDGDGFGDYQVWVDSCGIRPGYVLDPNDCDDSNGAIHPGATEICNGLDDDCDGDRDEDFERTLWFEDADGDGYGNVGVLACVQPPGYVAQSGDCDDTDATVHPGGTEVCDGKDNDCNGSVDDGVSTTFWYDFDGDGFGNPFYSVQACSLSAGIVANPDDCDDLRADVHPGASELCDGVDNDCDGETDESCAYLTLESIKDVKNDQGRNVRLTWFRSSRDGAPILYPTESYSVWRRIDGELASSKASQPLEWEALSRDGKVVAKGVANAAEAPDLPEVNDLPPGQWDFIAWVPAVGTDHYRLVSPTLCDSTSAGICWSVYFIRAHNDDLDEDSPPDSGYSVDNIVPGVPQNLSAMLVSGGHKLDWADSHDADFQYYRVYRGTDPGFVPGPGNLVQSTAASTWTDLTLSPFLYKVTTVDANGNESAPAATSLVAGVGDGEGDALAFAALAPNPFRGELSCAIVVPTTSKVELRIHDLAGRAVRTLHAGNLAAGRHSFTWNGRDGGGRAVAPGIYLVRLTGNGRASVRRVAFTP